MKTFLKLAAVAAFSLAILPASAEEAMDHGKMDHGKMDHGQMDHGAMAKEQPGDSPSTTAFRAADKAMMDGMAIDYSGNADVDFIRAMIPHHEGAVAMAEIELKYGKDPEARKLAEAVVAAQNEEITFMKAWLAKNGK